MAYRFAADESAAKGAKRIVRQEIDRAVRELTSRDVERHEAVHQARKRFKKIRGLLRLVRPAVGGVYAAENAWYRDTGRELSRVRDAEALIGTVRGLVERYVPKRDARSFDRTGRALAARRDRIADAEIDLDARAAAIAVELRAARRRVATWRLAPEGFDAIGPGLVRTYRRGRRAYALASSEPSPESFHEWRKLVKYHWYHVRLLEEMWPTVMTGRRDSLKELSRLLGDYHDLVVFRGTLAAEPAAFGPRRAALALDRLAARRLKGIEREARKLGRRAYAEKPRRLAARFREYWEAWRGKP